MYGDPGLPAHDSEHCECGKASAVYGDPSAKFPSLRRSAGNDFAAIAFFHENSKEQRSFPAALAFPAKKERARCKMIILQHATREILFRVKIPQEFAAILQYCNIG